MKPKEKMEEVSACCCVDVGSFICNNELTAEARFCYQSESDAKSALEHFREVANKIAKSEECKIKAEISPAQDGSFLLSADFTFGCEAEKMIFELKCFR